MIKILIFILFIIIIIILSIKFAIVGNAEDKLIKSLYDKDLTIFKTVFIPYMEYATKVPKDVINNMINMISTNTDVEIMEYIIDSAPMFKDTVKSQKGHAKYKTDKMITHFRKYVPSSTLNSYLDIGAVEIARIQNVSRVMQIPYNKCFGINIDEGADEAINYSTIKDEKIKIYNGFDIPAIAGIKKYDLISIISVLHHIPQKVLTKLIPSIYRRCGQYLIIKENDLCNEMSNTYFTLQHQLFWRSVNMKSYTRHDLTSEKIIGMFCDAGFTYIGYQGMDYFTRAKYFIFKK